MISLLLSLKDIGKAKQIKYLLFFILSLAINIHYANSQLAKGEERYYVLNDTILENIMHQRGHDLRYSEFHAHTGMKNLNNHIHSPEWLFKHLTDPTLKTLNWSGKDALLDDKFNNFKRFRQADWGILAKSNASIIVSAISPIEKHLLSRDHPIKGIPITFRWINKKLTGLPKSRLKKIYDSNNSSFSEFNSELIFLRSQNNSDPRYPNINISFATSKEDLISKYLSKKTVLALSLEGGHILHGAQISANKSYDHKIFTEKERKEILNNIDSIKNLPERVFFITLGHFSWNGIVGYSKTLDMDNSKRRLLRRLSRNREFRTKLFLKYGDGILGPVKDDQTTDDVPFDSADYCICHKTISPLNTGNIGYAVIEKLLDTSGKHHSPIFIDVKHMDIRARLDYYNFLKEKKISCPIIASHIAVSGKDTTLAKYTSLCPVFDVYEEVENPDAFYSYQTVAPSNKSRLACIDSNKINLEELKWFYPWGINLATEEIPIIYNSDGIIGLALEERVIGTGRPNYKKYLPFVDSFLIKNGVINIDSQNMFHAMLPVFKNIFFIVEHCGRKDKSAWDHISLGSDFDGIAKPLSFCKTAAEIPKFYRLLVEYLPLFISLENKESVLYGLTVKKIADKIVFENGERFILKYF